MADKLRLEIKQTQPFHSLQEEVALALARTVDVVSAPSGEVIRGAGLSASQYNVLRILRGAGREGLSCGEIAERMIRRDPDLTRLLDRLTDRGLVERGRDARDRRIVRASITKEGLALLAQLDPAIDASHQQALGHFSQKRLRELLEILEELREGGRS